MTGPTNAPAQEHVHTDHQLQAAVVRRLDWSDEVEAEHVGVGVTDGVVTLAGQVDSPAEADAAVSAATAVKGVCAVVDELVVRAGGLWHDADIARELQRRLIALRVDGGPAVHATVHARSVTVRGDVSGVADRDEVLALVARVPHVAQVVVQTTVEPTPSPLQVRASVTAALENAAQGEGRRLRIDVDGHTVVLSGTVHSSYESRAAEHSAASVPGVVRVDNNLTVV
ncbi:BON domain-containing protein [Jatrophihabitans fulvus]